MKEMYCSKRKNGKYEYFFNNPIAVSLCGVKKESIVPIKIREANEGEEHTHYGYLDIEDDEIRFIFEHYKSVQICSPDGFASKIEQGKGRIIKIVIEELEESTKLA